LEQQRHAAAGFRSGDNPARWKGNLQHLLAKPDKIASAVEGIAARALEFLIFTAVRTDEARLARWSEIDLEQRVWCLSADKDEVAFITLKALSDKTVHGFRSSSRGWTEERNRASTSRASRVAAFQAAASS
jgi:hypothetical protein